MLRNLEIRTSRIVNTLIAARCVQDLKSRLTQTAGELRINGNKISSDRAVELRLQAVNAGYRMSGGQRASETLPRRILWTFISLAPAGSMSESQH